MEGGGIKLLNEDCMAVMARYTDKYFDLVIADPPYGIGFGKFNRTNTDSTGVKIKANKYKNSDWDNSTPSEAYFNEIKRVSKNQIVWGGNYFFELAGKETPNLKTIEQFNKCIAESDQDWIFWYKQNPVPNFADGELAWISIKGKGKQYNYRYFGNIEGNTSASDKIHPTQKPIQLYKWLLKEYAEPSYKILDTHGGSFNSAIAASSANISEFIITEIDTDYFNKSLANFNLVTSQTKLF